jgi:hypothetical protein
MRGREYLPFLGVSPVLHTIRKLRHLSNSRFLERLLRIAAPFSDGSLIPTPLRYLLAVGVTLLALWVRYLLIPWLGTYNTYHTLWAALVFSAWYLGVGPSIVTVAVGILGVSATMPSRIDDPFDSIESAHSFLTLLRENVAEAKQELETDVQRASNSDTSRRLDALRIAAYKVEKLEFHLTRTSRILNDLRSLRRLLFEERTPTTAETKEASLASRSSSDDARNR